MSEHRNTTEQRQAHEKALFRYISALDRGDIDTVINVLHDAENDPLLEQMLFETHAAYQLEETMPQDITTEDKQPSQQTKYSDEGQINRHSQTNKKRWPVLLQLLSAVIVAAILIGGSLFLFQSHKPSTQVSTHNITQAPDTIISITNDGQITARDVNNGAITWQKTLPTRQPIDLYNGKPGLVIQHHVVYIAYQGYIQALQISNGKQLWKKQLGSNTASEVIGDNPPQIMADQNLIYVSGYLGSKLYALDQKTGALRWQYPSSAVSSLLAIGNSVIYVMENGDNDHNGIKALNSTSGKEIWRYPTSMPLSATIADNVLYVQTSHSFVNDPNGFHKEQKPLLALNATSGKLIWSIIAPSAGPSPLTVADGVVALFTGENFCAYQTSNGSHTWCTKNTATIPFNAPWTQVIAANSNIYGIAPGQSSTNNIVTSIAAIKAKNGAMLWTKQLPGSNSTTIITNNTLVTYANNLHQLQAISLTDGHLLWQISVIKKDYITNIVVGN
ncbi:PQQ-binding-like beta-propeller repeat protein [Dictyobacter kobayashii]|uniref:Pyrrolo-quinoline quinone repeat domain-containing protein n=1 Tax=Dictyobacter kobayashii TaxID=2014872 RepID=A0A402AL54_9CHLR|nr:PQQ-binding-like beta-propeller repeat protein [Dictyobacter kobayashii]GCE19740.1 hypothetical protein KDK_35400 [Dictyobacter kobayashii]